MMTLPIPLAAALPVPGRSVAASQHGVVASSQPLAAQAAVQILQRGGSAVDAALAAHSTQGLMEPTSSGVGGDLFALVYLAKEDKLYGLNASGWSPAGMTLEFLKSKGVERELPYRGVYSVTVPGAVPGAHAAAPRRARPRRFLRGRDGAGHRGDRARARRSDDGGRPGAVPGGV